MAGGAISNNARLADATKTVPPSSQLLTQHANENERQGDGATVLHWAIHWDDLDTAARLIKAGADVNAANEHGVTPLSLACTNDNPEIAEYLLAAGANPNAASKQARQF